MHYRILPIASLKPAPYNPRKPLKPGSAGYRRLARSIEEFDLVQPVVWNERTGHVVGGHQRLAILADRGETQVDCVVVDLPLEKEKALNVALNNAAVGSDWDENRLHELIAELKNLPGFDTTLTGFDADELQDLILAPALPSEEPAEQETSDAVTITLVIPNDLWPTLRPEIDHLVGAHGLEVHVAAPR